MLWIQFAAQRKTLPEREGKGAKLLPFALTGGFGLFLALNAGLFIMLAFTNFLKDAAAGALPLKPFERTFQGLIFADTNLGHCYPSPRSFTLCQQPATRTDGKTMVVLYSEIIHQSTILLNVFISGHLIRHLPASENVEVEMRNGLAGIGTAIGNYTESTGKGCVGCDLCNGTKARSCFLILQFPDFSNGSDMLFRNHQHMERRLRIDILKSINPVIFKYLCGRDFSADDFAEQTLIHKFILLFIFLLSSLRQEIGERQTES